MSTALPDNARFEALPFKGVSRAFAQPCCAPATGRTWMCGPDALAHGRARVWVGMVLALFIASFSFTIFAAVDPLPFKDHAEELRFQALTKQLRCLVCQNESLNDSAAPLAADLRRDVFAQMQAGKSDAQIKTWLTMRYSDFVLYDPPLRGGTWLLWFGPLLVLLAGAIAITGIVRRRAKAANKPAPATARSASDVEDDW